MTDSLQMEVEVLRRRVEQLEDLLRQADKPDGDSNLFARASDSLLAAIVESSDDAVISKDLHGTIRSWNRAAERMFGYRAEEVIGQPVSILSAPDREREFPEILNRIRRGERVDHYETVRRRRDGELICVSLTVSPIRNATGEIVGASKIARDITERKRLEDQLRTREREYHTLLAHLPDVVCRFDPELRFRYVSPAVERMTGHAPSFYFGKTHQEAGLPEELSQKQRASLQKVFAAGQPDSIDFDLQTADEVRHFHGIGIPEFGPDGGIVSALSIVRDVTARKSAEDALREREGQLALFIEMAPAGLAMLGRDLRYVAASRRFREDFHLPDDVVGRHHYELFPNLPERWKQIHQRCLQGATERADEDSFAGPDGKLVWLRWEIRPWYKAEGEPGGFILASEVITERRQAEATLREQLKLTQAIADGAAEAIFVMDSQGRTTFANSAAEQMFGWTPQELAGRKLHDVIHYQHADGRPFPMSECALAQVFTRGRALTAHEDTFWHRDGHPVAVLCSNSPVSEASGTKAAVLVVHDVTARKQAEAALRESEERLRLSAAAGQVGLWDWDIQTNSVVWSDRVYEFHGLPPGTFAGTVEAFIELIHPDDRARAAESVQRSLNAGEPYELEFRTIRPDGEVRWLVTSAGVIRDAAGHPRRMLGATIDITKRREIEDGLRRANAELQEFAYVASHDLQEPLRTVNLYTQWMLRLISTDDPKLREYAGYVQQGVDRMQELIRDLLDFSRTVHADRPPVSKTSLSEALEEALQVLQSRVEETKAVIRAPVLPLVQGDSKQLALVFQNLLSNSLKYRREDTAPEIHVTAKAEGSHWVVTVRDNGIGFAQEYAERIFGLFKRLHHRDEYPGTGLGLAICKRIVERYGGRIWAESEVGQGTSISFSLPAA